MTPKTITHLAISSLLPSPSLGEPLDDQIGEQRNRGSDDDRSNEHGCVNIPTLLQNVSQPCLIQRHWMLHRENQIPQSIFSQPHQRQKRGIKNRHRRPGDGGHHVPLQQPRPNGRREYWGWIQGKETGKDTDGEASSDLVGSSIEVRQLLLHLSDALFQGDSCHSSGSAFYKPILIAIPYMKAQHQ
jgi:hypothetical protein